MMGKCIFTIKKGHRVPEARRHMKTSFVFIMCVESYPFQYKYPLPTLRDG